MAFYDAMVRQIRTFKNSPLGESLGEECHRTSITAKRRAAHVRLERIMASFRHKRILYTCKPCLKKTGSWTATWSVQNGGCANACLKQKTKAKWSNAHLSDPAFYSRLYRIDDSGRQASGPSIKQAPVKLEPATTTSRLHTEYMASVIHVNTCYSVPIEMVVDGRPGEVSDQRMYISVLGTRGSSGAPKLVPTRASGCSRYRSRTSTFGAVTITTIA